MSWYTDPDLFINCWGEDRRYFVDKILKKYNVPLRKGDIKYVEVLDFSKHLFLGNNKESDYDAFKSSLPTTLGSMNKYYVNCQGLVVHWDTTKEVGTWSRVEEHDLVFYSLPGILQAEKLQAVEKLNLELVDEISGLKDKLNDVQEQLNQEKNERQALQTQVLQLISKLEECRVSGRRSAGVETWMCGCTVPSDWVPFEELDVLNIQGYPEFVEDTTTDVRPNRLPGNLSCSGCEHCRLDSQQQKGAV